MARASHRLILVAIGMVLTFATYLLYCTVDLRLLPTRINQLHVFFDWRTEHWDWQDTEVETFCRNYEGNEHVDATSKGPIPDVVHFVLLADEGRLVELSYAQFLAIKAAVIRMNASRIKLHTYGLNATNPWWQQIQDHVTLVHVARNGLRGPHGLDLKTLQLAHQSDWIRMDILMREGGIYLDTDVYVLKPFKDLLSSPRDIVMGHEGGNRYGLCNAVIVARAGSEFMSLWHESYKSFNPKVWNEHSVLRPKLLSVQYPGLICPLSPTVFFWPTWTASHARYMHEAISETEKTALLHDMASFGGVMYRNQLSIHDWGTHHYLAHLTPDEVMEKDTRFNILLRDVAAANL